jgi:tetratricopeptide (TPR) repeat protein
MMKRLGALAVFVAIMGVGSMAWAQTYDEVMKEAGAKYKARKYKDAAPLYEKAIGLATSDATKKSAQIRLGHSIYRSRKYLESVEVYKKAQENPSITDAEKNGLAWYMGEAYRYARKYPEARAQYEIRLAYKELPVRDRAYGHMRIGSTYTGERNYEKAREAHIKAGGVEGLDPATRSIAQLNHGLSYFSQKKYDECIAEMEKVGAIEGAHADSCARALNHVGHAKRAKKDFEGAKAAYVAAAAVEKSGWYQRMYAKLYLGDLLLGMKDYEGAHKAYAEMAELSSTSAHWIVIAQNKAARVFQAQKKYDEAIELLNKTLTTPKAPKGALSETYSLLGAIYAQKKDGENAMKSYRIGLDLQGGSTYSRGICGLNLARLLKGEKKFAEAKAVYERLTTEKWVRSYHKKPATIELAALVKQMGAVKE